MAFKIHFFRNSKLLGELPNIENLEDAVKYAKVGHKDHNADLTKILNNEGAVIWTNPDKI